MNTILRNNCRQCPRACGNDARCGVPAAAAVSRTGLHFDEEPCISGTKGSGTVFFAGCNLGCVFCQNAAISYAPKSYRLFTSKELADTFRALEDAGAHNINLVTPSHYADRILAALKLYRPKTPVVWNTSSYDTERTIDAMSEYVSVWLADLKFYDAALSGKYCAAPDYFDTAIAAIRRMRAHNPREVYDSDGMMTAGVIVRHLILPSHTVDSLRVLDAIAEVSPRPLLSLMSQYLPLGRACDFPEINRRITTYEYNKVLARAQELGFEGFSQARASAKQEYVPRWDEFIR